MKKIYFITFFILLTLFSFSQNERYVWYFGNNAGIDFNGGGPTAITNGALNTNEGTSCISDAAGNILFYTDGMTVWNRNHLIMSNGTGLHGNSSSIQSALIVKQPSSATIYYVFTTTNNANSYGMQYSIVDISLSGGLGSVTTKNVALVTPTGEKLVGIAHSNANDIWVLTHGYNNNTFYAYLLTSIGINPAIISNVGSSHSGGSAGAFNSALGAMKASPNGSKIAVCDQYSGVFEVVDFDISTGIVSNALSLSPLYRAFGTEFSEDGTKLYVTERQGSKMWQFDMSAGSSAAIQASKTLITSAGSYNYGALQRGPYGKMYLAKDAQTYLGVINNPNLAGTSCNYVENGFYLAGRICQEGLPIMDNKIINLPVELITFYSKCENGNVILEWETASETNNHYFEVQYSNNCANFESLGQIQGANNSNTINYYNFTDSENSSGYYRLKQVDYNGKSTLYDIIFVDCVDEIEDVLTLYPNPALTEININYNGLIKEVIIINSLGEVVLKQKINKSNVDISCLNSGSYYIKLLTKNTCIISKFIKL
jgi:Secretion system C-terminal sorting domain